MRTDAATAPGSLPRRFGAPTATLAVVANMIGTGVFTTTGLLVGELGAARTALLAWLIGGVAALAGALSYAELTAGVPRNGGEYRLLTEIYHPAVGFIAGLNALLMYIGYTLSLLHHVPDRPVWLSRIASGMKHGARLALVEFKAGKLPEGPPESAKIPRAQLLSLFSAAGLTLDRDKTDLLPYQVFLVFRKP